MRRFVISIGVLALSLAACGGGAESCETIADEGIVLLQEFVDEVDGMTEEELAAAIGGAAFLEDLEGRADTLDQRAADAGCSEDEITSLLDERSGSLSAESEFGQVIVDLIGSAGFFESE